MLNLAQRLMLDRFSPSENCLFNSETTAEVDSSLVSAMVDVFITVVAGICGDRCRGYLDQGGSEGKNHPIEM